MATLPEAVTAEEFEGAKRRYPSLAVVYRTREGLIKAVSFKLHGRSDTAFLAGGGGARMVWFDLFAEVGAIRGVEMPSVYVVGPPGATRPYIIGPGYSQLLKRQAPFICFGHNNPGDHVWAWATGPRQERTLLSLIQRAEQLLAS